jgi:AraC-like DNA-binding protein
VLVIRALVQAAEAAGVSAVDLFFAARFDGHRLMDARETISADEHRALVDAAIDLTGDPAFGLHAAERSTYAAFGVTSQLLAYAPSLRAAIGARRRFHRLLVDEPDIALVESRDNAAIELVLSSDAGSSRYARYNAEFSMVSVLRLIQHFGVQRADVRQILFAHDCPTYGAEYRRIFLGMERFGQGATRLELRAAVLDRSHFHASHELYAAALGEAERQLAELGGPRTHSDRLRDFLLVRLGSEKLSMERAARQLGMSVRSLRRRLTEEGTSYQDVAEVARAMVARRLLKDPERSIQETASLLGFSDSSAFYRAFKRWTGVTPSQFRRRDQPS